MNKRPKNIGVLGQIVLSQGRHHASWIEQGYVEKCAITKPESMATQSFSMKPGRSVSMITFMRNLPSRKRLSGRSSFSRASVDVVSTDRGNTSKKDPTETGEPPQPRYRTYDFTARHVILPRVGSASCPGHSGSLSEPSTKPTPIEVKEADRIKKVA